jgi:hypothetical protein
MTFLEAVNSGKVHRRTTATDRDWWRVDSDGQWECWESDDGRDMRGMIYGEPLWTREDYNATDWEIAP